MDDQLLAIQRVYSKQVQDAKIKLDRAKNSERQNIKQFVEVNKAEVWALDKKFAQDKHKLEVEHGLINIDPDIEDRASRRGTNLAFNDEDIDKERNMFFFGRIYSKIFGKKQQTNSHNNKVHNSESQVIKIIQKESNISSKCMFGSCCIAFICFGHVLLCLTLIYILTYTNVTMLH